MRHRVLVATIAVALAFSMTWHRPFALAAAPAPDDSLVALLPDSGGFYNLQFRATVNGQPVVLPCRVFLPRGYEKSKDPAPLLVFLHGDDERGTDLAALLTVGPEKRLRDDQGFRDNMRSIIVSPQCPKDKTWDDAAMAQAVLGLVEQISSRFRVDADRVSLTGTGMGGAGAWRVAGLAPERFAAVAATSAKAPIAEGIAPKLRHVYAYVASPQNEKPAYEAFLQTTEALGRAHAEIQARLVGNNVKETTQWFYNDNANWDWINQKKRRTAQEKKDREDRDAKQYADYLASLPKAPGVYKLKFSTWCGDKVQDIPFELIVPTGYKPDSGNWPTLLFLCGAGEVNPNLAGVDANGPGSKIGQDAAFRAWCPFIIIEPIHDNSPERCRAITELVRDLEQHIRIDPDRVYVTGLSLGGTSTWVTATAAPDLFAAVIPINGRERCNDIAAKHLKYITSWIIVGGDDGDFYKGSVNMQNLLAAAGNDTHLTVIPHEGHGSWWRYYQDRRFYDWLLQHHRLSPQERAERDKFPTTAPADMLAHADKHPTLLRPGHHWLEFRTQLGGKPFILEYSLYLPRGYDTGNDRFPLTVYLHPDDVRFTDQSMIFDWGSGIDPRKDEKLHTPFPMIGLVPQLPENHQWTEPEMVKINLALIDEVSKVIRVDADRVYATGVQSGANGAWALALEAPERFAAIAPMQGGVVKLDEVAKKLRHLAARVMAPAGDGGATNAARQMVDALRKARADVRLALLPNTQDPNAWTPYYTAPELTDWLMSHRRPSPQERKDREDRETREAAAKLPTTPGDYPQKFEMQIDGKPFAMSYRVWLPKDYDKSQNRYPLVAYLHGENMPATQPSDGNWGPDLDLRGNTKLADAFPLIGVFPQLPAGRRWNEPAVVKGTAALINDVVLKFRVDADRVYAAGVNGGGAGACRVAMEAPDLFAAIAAAAPGMKPEEVGVQMKGVATWVIGPADDLLAADAAKKLADAIQKTQTEVQVTQVEGQGTKPWITFYGDPKTYEWLLRHRRQR